MKVMAANSTFSDVLTLIETTITDFVNTVQAAINTAPTGAVQSGIDFGALESANGLFLQLGGDTIQVFAQDYEAIITEVLAAATLASSIVGNIESAISIGVDAGGKAGFAVAAAAATADTVTSVLAQAQAAATATLNAFTTYYAALTNPTPSTNPNSVQLSTSPNLPSGNELQVLGGYILFQQQINNYLNSLPTTVGAANESNAGVIALLQNLITAENNLTTLLGEIQTNMTYEQASALTGLNVQLVYNAGAILGDADLVAVTFALWALEGLTGTPASVTIAGAYTVPIPAGTKYMDIVLIGGAGAGGGYDTPGSGTGGDGEATTATPTGGSTLTANGGTGGASSTTALASAGASAGTEFFDGRTYTGGTGGALGYSSAGGTGGAPGGAGGGGASALIIGGQGGTAGEWAEQTLAVTAEMTEITGTVGAGGTGGASSSTEPGGAGAPGAAYFYFYS